MSIPSAIATASRAAVRRNVYVFGATSFLNDTASEMAYWILPAFLATLGAGPAQLGMIEGLAESVAAVAKLFSGRLTDRIARRKPIVVFGYALANVVKPLLAFSTRWWHVLMVRFADRTAKGIRGAPRDVMLAESVDRKALGGAFGMLQAMDSAGAIAGPLLAVFILSHHGIRAVFWAAAVPGLLSVAVVALFARETQRSTSPMPAADGKASASAAAPLPAAFYYVLTAVTLFSIGNSSDMFLILRAQNLGMAATYAPLLGLVFNLVYTAASWPAGRLSDKVPKRFIAAAGYVVFAAVYFVFAVAPSHPALWPAMAGYGLYYAFTDPVLRALIAQSIPPESRGRAFGVYFFVSSVAALSASVLAGQLWKYFGAAVPFYLSATLAVVAAALLAFAPKKFQSRNP